MMSYDIPDAETTYPARAVSALLRLRDLQERQARKAFLHQQRQVAELQIEVEGLRRRRAALARGESAEGLDVRRFGVALLARILERTGEFEALQAEAARLMVVYRETHRGKQAVMQLQAKQKIESERQATRRMEAADGDLAAARVTREEARREESRVRQETEAGVAP